jgi:hypothetical protein
VVNLVFSIQELWAELKNVCPNAPSRSQFYEWLKASWCIKPQPRGGIKQPALFTEADLNRLIRFAQLKQLTGSLKASQEALLTEIQNNPELYGG